MFQSEQYQVGIILEVERFHNVMLVEFHRLLLRSSNPAISFMGRPSANNCTISRCRAVKFRSILSRPRFRRDPILRFSLAVK